MRQTRMGSSKPVNCSLSAMALRCLISRRKSLRLGPVEYIIGQHQVVALAFFQQAGGEVHDGTEIIQLVVGIDREARAGVKGAFELEPDVRFVFTPKGTRCIVHGVARR